MAFSSRFRTAGRVISWSQARGICSIEMEFGFQHIRRFGNGIFQVQFSQTAEPDFFSYSIENELMGDILVDEGAESISFGHPLLSALLSKSSGHWKWLDAAKNLMASQEDGLGFGWLGEKCITTFKLTEGQQFFGLGEKGGSLNRKGRAFTNWNTDAFAYQDGSDPLYTSIPFFMVVNEGVCHGVLIDNTTRSRVNFGASNDRMVQVTVDAGPLNLLLIPGPSPEEVLSRYTQLTGHMPMPPKWALGFQQCRYSYYPQYEVDAIAGGYRNRDIPADVVYLDIHYMQDYKVFTVDEKRFPSIRKLTAELALIGFRVVPIQDPGIKIEKGYPAYDSGMADDVFVKYPDGKNWTASVWPGACHFPDFTKENARKWWADQTAEWIAETGIGGLWNDMNEPASWGQDTPDMLEFSIENRLGNHLEAHNIYGQQMARSSREGLLQARPQERPFVLTRAGFAGIQRYAAVWTGDNISTDEHMFLGIRLVLSLGMSGVSFSGVDVGGFVGEASNQLFMRWTSVAAFFPFFRVHTMIDSKDSEPWSYGELAESVVRNYIRLRYCLMPMLNTAFYHSSKSGYPILTPFFWKQPGYRFEEAFQHQFYLGNQLLVVPVSSHQNAVLADIPAGGWRHLLTGQQFNEPGHHWIGAPTDLLPILVKDGSILVTQKVGTHTLDPEAQAFQLHLFYGKTGSVTFWYDDDGLSLEQKTNDRMEADFIFDPVHLKLSGKRINDAAKHWKISQIYLWHFPQAFADKASLYIENQAYPLIKSEFNWVESLPNFDPFQDSSRHYYNKCLSASINLPSGNFEIEIKPGN